MMLELHSAYLQTAESRCGEDSSALSTGTSFSVSTTAIHSSTGPVEEPGKSRWAVGSRNPLPIPKRHLPALLTPRVVNPGAWQRGVSIRIPRETLSPRNVSQPIRTEPELSESRREKIRP